MLKKKPMKKPTILKLTDTATGPTWVIHTGHGCVTEQQMETYCKSIDPKKLTFGVIDLGRPYDDPEANNCWEP